MSETQDLEREIQRLSEIIGASESALKAKAMSGSDRAWLTKQLGLRRIRLSRLRARLEGLRLSRPSRPSARGPYGRVTLSRRCRSSGAGVASTDGMKSPGRRLQARPGGSAWKQRRTWQKNRRRTLGKTHGIT